MTKLIIIDKNKLNIDSEILNLKEIIFNESKDDRMNRIKSIEKILNEIAGAELIKEKLSKARRILKKDDSDINKINTLLDEANEIICLKKNGEQRQKKNYYLN